MPGGSGDEQKLQRRLKAAQAKAKELRVELDGTKAELVQALADNSQLQARVQALQEQLRGAEQGKPGAGASLNSNSNVEPAEPAPEVLEAAAVASGVMARLLAEKGLGSEGRMFYAQSLNRILALLLQGGEDT